MTLTTTKIELVQRSWAAILPRAQQTARLFCAQLFETLPELRPLFRFDMEEQGRKLMAMLNLAVASLGRLEPLLATIQESGKRHAAYGVTDQDYTCRNRRWPIQTPVDSSGYSSIAPRTNRV